MSVFCYICTSRHVLVPGAVPDADAAVVIIAVLFRSSTCTSAPFSSRGIGSVI